MTHQRARSKWDRWEINGDRRTELSGLRDEDSSGDGKNVMGPGSYGDLLQAQGRERRSQSRRKDGLESHPF